MTTQSNKRHFEHSILWNYELQESPRFSDVVQSLDWQPQSFERPTKLKVKEKTFKDRDEISLLYENWISENSLSSISKLTTITQLQSNPLFIESGKISEDKEEASTSFEVHNTRESTMYYRSPSLNMASKLPWRLKAIEFRSNSPIRKEVKTYFEKLKKILGYKDPVEDYYNKQDKLLESYYEADDINKHGGYIPTSSQEERLATKRGETIAINLSNYANVILLLSKLYASITSMSLAIIASTMDSLLDLLSGAILWWAAHSMRNLNKYLYPIGKKRRQPLGIMIFACVMAMLGLEIIVESCRKLTSEDHSSDLGTGTKRTWVISIMVGVTIVKFVLTIICRQYPDNEIVKAYAQDHFFDVITNSIGLGAALLGQAYVWWLDPLGAILLALYTIRTWTGTLLESAQSLSSTSAPPKFLAKLTYLVWNHDRAIVKIDTIRAYTLGEQYFVEIDIILPRNMLLWKAHDIGESLQNKLETLPEIERAFVHLDYDDKHILEHIGHDDY